MQKHTVPFSAVLTISSPQTQIGCLQPEALRLGNVLQQDGPLPAAFSVSISDHGISPETKHQLNFEATFLGQRSASQPREKKIEMVADTTK